MLSEVIKKKIEEKANMQIRYSRDCEALAAKIYSECKCRLSASTLRRIFGFGNSSVVPRTDSLDVLAMFLGEDSFDKLIASLDKTNPVKEKPITELKAAKLKSGDRYCYNYRPNAEVILEYLGKAKFKVMQATKSQLIPGDVFKTTIIELHHPLFITGVERDGKSIGGLIEGKISGITSIKKIT